MIVLKRSKVIQVSVFLTVHHIYGQNGYDVMKNLQRAVMSRWHIHHYSTHFSFFLKIFLSSFSLLDGILKFFQIVSENVLFQYVKSVIWCVTLIKIKLLTFCGCQHYLLRKTPLPEKKPFPILLAEEIWAWIRESHQLVCNINE